MPYSIKEIYYSIQGEGARSGRPAVFCRFSGCNLWSGREQDRADAVCRFCDTAFAGTDGPGGGQFISATELARAARSRWPATGGPDTRPYVVCTGGEPLLQLDEPLLRAFHECGAEVAIETNGTILPPAGIDWICVSPKAGTTLALNAGHELKLVFPQSGAGPERFADLQFNEFFLQPMDGPAGKENTRLAVLYCLEHPRWKLSLQMHKILGLP
jgi:7-carboxy-7-deazaguanine synthase (Cx14CxxC type)